MAEENNNLLGSWILCLGNVEGPSREGVLCLARSGTSTGKTGTAGAGGVGGTHFQRDFFNYVWAGLAVTVTWNASMWPFHVVGFSLHRERVLRNSISGRNSVPGDHPRRSQPSSFSPGNSDRLAQIPGRKHRLVLNGRHA